MCVCVYLYIMNDFTNSQAVYFLTFLPITFFATHGGVKCGLRSLAQMALKAQILQAQDRW
jgi:hypothetical protein